MSSTETASEEKNIILLPQEGKRKNQYFVENGILCYYQTAETRYKKKNGELVVYRNIVKRKARPKKDMSKHHYEMCLKKMDKLFYNFNELPSEMKKEMSSKIFKRFNIS